MCPSIPASVKRTETPASMPQDDAKSSRAMPPGSSPLDLAECSASALADYLMQHRFSGNTSKSVEFLQQAVKALQSADAKSAAAAPQAVPVPATKSSSTGAGMENVGDPLLATPLETSLLNPRGGKCSIQLYQNGYLVATQLKDPSVQLVLPASAISHMIFFAKAEDYKLLQSSTPKKQPNAHLVLLKLHDSANVEFQNKKVQGQICFALSWVKGVGPTGPETTTSSTENNNVESGGGWLHATQAWRTVLETCLGGLNNPTLVTAQVQPQQTSDGSAPFFSFQAPDQSTTTGGMPFVKCYLGVQDGVLYPLREGLLFYKPPRFLPRSDLVSIACGRGSGGQSSSRYVDMVVQLQQSQNSTSSNDAPVEYTNIQREELGVLNEYIHQVLIPAMQADAAKEGATDVRANNKEGSRGGKKDGDDGHGDDGSSTEDDDEDHATEMEEDTDDEDENFVDGDEESDAHVDEGDDDDDDSDDDDDDDGDEDDDFEIVDDDFAKELTNKAKKGGMVVHDEPRASRSSKRKGSPTSTVKVEAVVEASDEDAIVADDDDFEVVQAASSTESEADDGSAASGSPAKKNRHH